MSEQCKSLRPLGRTTALRAMSCIAALGAFTIAGEAFAQSAEPLTWEAYQQSTALTSADAIKASPLGSDGGGFPVNFVWTMVAAILVFWMQAGFAMVEAGFTRAKNAVNIVMKNIMDFAFGSLIFWAIGFGLMFGTSNGLFGTDGFFMIGYSDQPWSYAFLLFQTVFAGTAATIVSGAMAERMRFRAYLISTFVITAIIYPIFGSWVWGGLFQGRGWLTAPEGGLLAGIGLPGFIDFAGSTVVHSVGGWAALAGALVIGPRLGRNNQDGTINPILGHNLPLCALGVFILWMGWFGFNAGSTLGATGGGDALFGGVGKAMAIIAVNTNLAACAGCVTAMFISWRFLGKPDVGLTLNGALAGLVSITAGCATVAPWAAVVIGMVAGGLVYSSVLFFDRHGVDDPVGAISVHGVCGTWGTLAVALFHVNGLSLAQLATQAIGVLTAFAWTFSLAFGLFKLLDKLVGLRVTAEEELEGLDLTCHGATAYADDMTGGSVPVDPPEAYARY